MHALTLVARSYALLSLEFISKIDVFFITSPLLGYITLNSFVDRFLLERAVVGILRLAIRLMSRETLASQVSVRGCCDLRVDEGLNW